MMPKQNKFETFDLTFSNENSSIRGHLAYELSSDDTSPISPESLRRVVDGLNEVLKKVAQDYRVIESNETEINDNYAISQITYEKVYDTENGVWKVYSIVNNRTFTFDYISSPTEFDKGLPTVEKMFNSIKFLN